MSARLLKDPATASSRIFIGHLQTDDITKLELEDHFAKYGTVIASVINRGFGFVQFEEEQSAQNAIQKENGAMFKGRRIDVRPAKKDNQSSGSAGNINTKQMSGLNNQFNSMNQFNNANESFGMNKPNYAGGMNQSFGNDNTFGNNQKDLNAPSRSSGNNHFDDGNQAGSKNNDQFNGKHNNNNNNSGNDHFNNPMQNRGNNQFNTNNPIRGNDQLGHGNQNRGTNNQFGNNNQMGNQNRPGGIPNRNQTNPGNNQNQNVGGTGMGPGGGVHRPRGTRGGKNRNKNNQNNSNNSNINNFRDRSPINRNNRMEDKTNRDWDLKQGDRLRNNNFPRDSFNDSGNRYDDFKAPGPRETNANFGNTSGSSDYLTIAAEKNDCEIIVVNKALTKYAEDIELRLKQIGLMVDLLFPNEDVPLGRVLGNIASRGCLYAVVVTPINHEHHSLTLNILHGLPQEHRNMPVEDAINLISRDFTNYKSGGRSVPLNTPLASERHPDAIQVLLNMLADNHQLTVLQYDRVIKYLDMKREEQVQVELGDAKDLPVKTSLAAVNDPKQAELQTRILNILNNSKTASTTMEPSPVPPPTSAPASVPSANWGTASNAVTSSTTTSSTGVSPSPLLNDPTVQKALDSLLQGNLLKNIGDQQPSPATTSGAPLFAAFSNIGRF
ncbi:Nuclear receptor coactivator 5 [Trachymyrmex zeteki]|uniref:Nuclear receptor coactivator 5 n=1 Tax=Mycetomoellerius zeteki TaxID=64791 RepID=A0A151WGF2_9HYME|nr:PREDICTED: polyadenylate-binding protein 1-B-like [Trachymyrmex zeteki]XP_018315530.1 PREDICTED: polyadenylate-binding protein 1-B-like [Trachymyrmex zeteki]XP_018315531.1 PREDICTED: polyadenylate-binding protein 1-B-like [Trachymyrmex zeteki]KYQ46885.1 Nuclear receptor coactivator 5 [Trachymyrmex zeteki]